MNKFSLVVVKERSIGRIKEIKFWNDITGNTYEEKKAVLDYEQLHNQDSLYFVHNKILPKSAHEILKNISEIKGENENQHRYADMVLVSLLSSLGQEEIAQAYENIFPKYYA